MADTSRQSFAHHTRWDPIYHFFLVPVFVFAVITGIVILVKHPGLHSAVMLLVAAWQVGVRFRPRPAAAASRRGLQ